jgi:hypothetical protein
MISEELVQLFKAHTKVIEFALIEAALISRNKLEELYWGNTFIVGGIWPVDVASINQHNHLLGYYYKDNNDYLSLSIHRKCFSQLTDSTLNQVKQIWQKLDLADQTAADALIAEMQRLNP